MAMPENQKQRLEKEELTVDPHEGSRIGVARYHTIPVWLVYIFVSRMINVTRIDASCLHIWVVRALLSRSHLPRLIPIKNGPWRRKRVYVLRAFERLISEHGS